MPDRHAITALHVADEAAAWERAGFDVVADTVALDGLVIHLHGQPDHRGLWAWSLEPRPEQAPHGLAVQPPRQPEPAGRHPNHVTSVDHIVIGTPDLEQTTTAFGAVGWEVRRTMRHPTLERTLRFFLAPTRAGRVALEVMEPDDSRPADKPARFWGLALTTDNLDGAAASLGPDVIGDPKDAVQPGRRIATIRTEALDISVPLALMTPRP